MTEPTRRTLLHRVRDAEDEAAWSEFFRLYAPLLESYARAQGLTPADAEDVRDQCLAIVARKMRGFEYERERGGFQGWLYRIVHGKVVDHLRRPQARQAETRELELLRARQPSPDRAWEENWRAEHLRACLEVARAKESARTFQAFELLLEGRLTPAEVGAQLGMNTNQVYKAKARVLARVREAYERIGAGPGSLFGA